MGFARAMEYKYLSFSRLVSTWIVELTDTIVFGVKDLYLNFSTHFYFSVTNYLPICLLSLSFAIWERMVPWCQLWVSGSWEHRTQFMEKS